MEYGFMSTSADKSVAVQYSGVKEGKPKAGILQIHPNSVDRGADISEFSQYPAEKEFLFVPYSFVQGEGRQRTEVVDGGGVLTVVSVRVNINLKTETVEELKEKKKRLHLVSARAMVEEVRYELGEWAASPEAAARLQRDATRRQGGVFTAASLASAVVEQGRAVMKRHEAKAVEEYVDDGAFRALVGEMLDTKACAKEKKEPPLVSVASLVSLVKTELFVVNALQRPLVWFRNTLFAENLQDAGIPSLVVVSDKDHIVPHRAVFEHVTAHEKGCIDRGEKPLVHVESLADSDHGGLVFDESQRTRALQMLEGALLQS
jgi:hypothetical protein